MNIIYKRYVQAQNNNPNYIIAMKCGDFYQILGFGAIIVANQLNFTLTGRECGVEERALMVGFPLCMKDTVQEQMSNSVFNIKFIDY